MALADELGNRIRLYRKAKHLSQENLAELCNFHPTYIGQLERGEKNATLETVYKISQGLDMSLNELLADIDLVDSSTANTALEVYHTLMKLSPTEQEAVSEIVLKIVKLTQKTES